MGFGRLRRSRREALGGGLLGAPTWVNIACHSWFNPAPVHAYFFWNSKTWIDRFEIVGREGKVIADPLDTDALTVIRRREREELKIPPPENAHLPCVEDFMQAVREKRAPLCDGEAGLRTNRLLAASLE